MRGEERKGEVYHRRRGERREVSEDVIKVKNERRGNYKVKEGRKERATQK